MEWAAKKKKVKEPKKPIRVGDIKESKRFAFFPTKIKGQWVWLEKYIAVLELVPKTLTEEVEVSSGLIEDALNVTGLVNSRTRLVTTNWNSWDVIEKKRIVK